MRALISALVALAAGIVVPTAAGAGSGGVTVPVTTPTATSTTPTTTGSTTTTPRSFTPAPVPPAAPASGPLIRLDRTLGANIRAAGPFSGAYVVDLNTGKSLFGAAAFAGRMPASVEKIYTTTTALDRWGPGATFHTDVLGDGTLATGGLYYGTLYLRGGGDPTFGQAAFDHAWYGGGTTLQKLVADLIAQTGITYLSGRIEGDESLFDSLRGTAPYRYHPSTEIEGELSALAYDRGFSNNAGTQLQIHPALLAAQQFAAALKASGVTLAKGTKIGAGTAPAGASLLSSEPSPLLSQIIGWTNAPSDNFFAEMLLKGLGASFGGAGSSAAGASVVRADMASYGIRPTLVDGSGLSRQDRTSPFQIVTMLANMAANQDFVGSLAVVGGTGTMKMRMVRTAAAGRCEAKSGTLIDASNLAGYCRAKDGHTLAFAWLMNRVNVDAAHNLQDAMTEALAGYNG